MRFPKKLAPRSGSRSNNTGNKEKGPAPRSLRLEQLEDRAMLAFDPQMIANLTAGGSGSHPLYPTSLNGFVYFQSYEGAESGYVSLWRSDGTQAGTTIVTQCGCVGPMIAFDGALYFASRDNQNAPIQHGIELWKSDGTAAGTVMVKDIETTYSGWDSFPQEFIVVNSALYFMASIYQKGWGLWKTDGTESGTEMIKEAGLQGHIPGMSYHGYETKLVSGDGMLFFEATTGWTKELWKSDGTAEGTVRVKGSFPWNDIEEITYVDGALFFRIDNQLWKSDGTESGTLMIKEFYALQDLTAVGGALYFSAADSYTNGGYQSNGLWRSDGTTVGTVLVKDFFPGYPPLYYGWSPTISTNDPSRILFSYTYGANYAFPWDLVDVDGTLFFLAQDFSGRRLWKSDGTEAGTSPLTPVGDPWLFKRVVIDDKLFFTFGDSNHGGELWTSDGTLNGTFMVEDSTPGSTGSWPTEILSFNGGLFFNGDDGTHGREPWVIPPFNHMPSGADKTISVSQGTAYSMTRADFGFSDAGPLNAFLAVKIATLPASGSLTLDGVPVTAGQFVSVADLDSGELEYFPPTSATSNEFAHFTFQVQDDGGTSDGGKDLDRSPNTITLVPSLDIDVTAFYSDGTQLKIGYSVLEFSPQPYKISVFASPDGVVLGEKLAERDGGTQVGNYTLSFDPEFSDWQEDYRLVAVADPTDQIFESDATNNRKQFSGGVFVATEPVSLKKVLHIVGSNGDDSIIADQVGSTLRLTQGGQSHEYSVAAIDEIHFRGLGGDDKFIATDSVLLDMQLLGGSGDDVLAGGAGDDELFGGEGDDTLDAPGSGKRVYSDALTPVYVTPNAAAMEGSPVEVVLTLNAPAPEEISIPYWTNDVSAVSPTDYEGTSNGLIVFAPGDTQATITIPTYQNQTSTTDITFTIEFAPPQSWQTQTTTVPVIIAKLGNMQVVEFSGDTGVTEGTAFQGTFHLAAPAINNITINYHTVDGLFISPGNYQGGAGTVTIPAGGMSGRFQIPVGSLTPLQRQLQVNPTFDIVVDSVTGASAGATAGSKTVYIIDATCGSLSSVPIDVVAGFDEMSDSGIAASTKKMRVTRDCSQGTQATTINLVLENDTAVHGVNFGGPATIAVPLPEGQRSADFVVPFFHNDALPKGESWSGWFNIRMESVASGHPQGHPEPLRLLVQIHDKSLDAVNDYVDTGLNAGVPGQTNFIELSPLGNDTASLWSIRVLSVQQPSHGRAVINRLDNTIQYLPDVGFAGIDSFTYTITDDKGQYDTATIQVGVGRQNYQASWEVQGEWDVNDDGNEEGPQRMKLVVTLDHVAVTDVTVHYSLLETVPGHYSSDTVSAADLVNPSGDVIVRAGDTQGYVWLNVNDDAITEMNEYGLVKLDVLYADWANVVGSGQNYIVRTAQENAEFKILDNEWRWDTLNPSIWYTPGDSGEISIVFFNGTTGRLTSDYLVEGLWHNPVSPFDGHNAVSVEMAGKFTKWNEVIPPQSWEASASDLWAFSHDNQTGQIFHVNGNHPDIDDENSDLEVKVRSQLPEIDNSGESVHTATVYVEGAAGVNGSWSFSGGWGTLEFSVDESWGAKNGTYSTVVQLLLRKGASN